MEETRTKKDRLVVVDGKWVRSSKSQDELREMFSGLTAVQRQLLTRKVTHKETLLTKEVQAIWDEVKEDAGMVLLVLQTIANQTISTVRRDLKYRVTTKSYAYGTSTELSDSINACWTWGTKNTEAGKPDVVASVAEMAASFAKPTESGPVAETFSKSKVAQTYFPQRNLLGSVFNGLTQKPTTHDALVTAIKPYVAHTSLGREQVIDDIVSCQPRALRVSKAPGVRKLTTKSGRSLLIKAAPVKLNSLNIPFPTAVEAISVMSSALGSRKSGFGKMSEFHYDGIGALEGAMRAQHEWLTDFVYQEADVYLLRTRDPNFAVAFQRLVAKNHPGDFVVVYESSQCDYQKLRDVFKHDKNSAITGVAASGIVGVGVLMWDKFDNVTTYYVNFKAYTAGRGHKSELVSSSIENRRTEQETASTFDAYFYYGFIGAMDESDLAVPSCRGRKGDVIFMNPGDYKSYDRGTMALIVFNCVRHALLYPWLHSCFRFKLNDKYFYDGVRESLDVYDFSRLDASSDLHHDFQDAEVAPDAINGIYNDLFDSDSASVVEKRARAVNSAPPVPRRSSAALPVKSETQQIDEALADELTSFIDEEDGAD